MINVKFLNIDNAKLMGRLLPHWLRGSRASRLLQAVTSPLVSLHNQFKAWALEYYVMAHITAQRESIQWYLTYRLREHFRDKDDKFDVRCGLRNPVNLLFTRSEQRETYLYTSPIFSREELSDNEELKGRNMVIYRRGEVYEATGVADIFAPAIEELYNYDKEDYRKEIKSIMDKFMTNFRKYNIIILE